MTTSHAPVLPGVLGTAAPLAELLPARRNRPWTVQPAEHQVRRGAPCARLTDGRRVLWLVDGEAGRLEVFADRPGLAPLRPDLVEDSGPGAAGVLAGRLLRETLPQLDDEQARAQAEGDADALFKARMFDAVDVGFALVDHGAHPDAVNGGRWAAFSWEADGGARWALRLHRPQTLSLAYEGPAGGLYGALERLLPPGAGRGPSDAGSAFTRLFTDRFSVLAPLDDAEVQWPGRGPFGSGGYIMLPDKEVVVDRADGRTLVAAEFAPLGVDLLLSAVASLV
ncbi:hypothetical protein ACIQWY_29865 [Streptomyces albidoflavus]